MTNDIGCRKDELDTPALCIDLEKLAANISSVVDRCRRASVAWRPHAKCHKSPIIARRLVAAGAIGVTCAKLGEAEIMAHGGIEDLLIANFIVGPKKIRRLVDLRRICDVVTCVDHPDQLGPVGRAMEAAQLELRVLVELDIGMQRAGVPTSSAAVALARQVLETPGLTLAGVMGYEGHLLQIRDLSEKARLIRESIKQLTRAAQMMVAAGLPCPIVSCGGTGSYVFTVEQPGITEIQAGGAIFMDQFYRRECQVADLQPALTVLATVVSCPAPDRAIVDAGRKTMDAQIGTPLVMNQPGISVDYLSAEHGVLRLSADARPLRIGQRLEFIPGYADFTTVLHDQFHVMRDDRLVARWPLAARGKLQ